MNRFLLLAFTLGIVPAIADEKPAVASKDVPGDGFIPSHYETLWTKSPFAVATPDAAPETIDYTLVGIARFDGVIYASLIDKSNNESFLLSTDKPVRGLTLTAVNRGTNPTATTAIIQRNGEMLTLKLEQAAAMMAGSAPVPQFNASIMPAPGSVNFPAPSLINPTRAPGSLPAPGGGSLPGGQLGANRGQPGSARPPVRFRRNIFVPPNGGQPGVAPPAVTPEPQPPRPPGQIIQPTPDGSHSINET